MQLLQRARNATTGEARRHCLAAALDRLSHAKEQLLQQATAVRAAAARARDHHIATAGCNLARQLAAAEADVADDGMSSSDT